MNKIHEMNLKNETKMKIIFEIMIIIEYLHYNRFIYRDIRPQNLIIDNNNNNSVCMIDFD